MQNYSPLQQKIHVFKTHIYPESILLLDAFCFSKIVTKSIPSKHSLYCSGCMLYVFQNKVCFTNIMINNFNEKIPHILPICLFWYLRTQLCLSSPLTEILMF